MKLPPTSSETSLASQALGRAAGGTTSPPAGSAAPGALGSPGAQGSPASPGSPSAPGSAGSPGSSGAPGSSGTPGAPPPTAAAAAPASYERSALNLARQPFVNSRPVKRLAAVLWVLGVLLLVANVTLFWGYLANSEQTRAALASAERKGAGERQRVGELAGRIAGMNLEQQNHEVVFLNRKIAERTFSWSQLFDRLAEVLPDGVRLNQLTPQGPAEKEQPGRAAPLTGADKSTPVLVQILGEAKNDEALLLFVKRLFAHPAFADPDLGHEERVESGLLKFDLKVKYLPTGTSPGAGEQVPGASGRGAPGASAAAAGKRIRRQSRSTTRSAPRLTPRLTPQEPR